MKNWLKVALDYRKKNMLPSDVVEEVMLDDMSMEDATDLWMALILSMVAESLEDV